MTITCSSFAACHTQDHVELAFSIPHAAFATVFAAFATVIAAYASTSTPSLQIEIRFRIILSVYATYLARTFLLSSNVKQSPHVHSAHAVHSSAHASSSLVPSNNQETRTLNGKLNLSMYDELLSHIPASPSRNQHIELPA